MTTNKLSKPHESLDHCTNNPSETHTGSRILYSLSQATRSLSDLTLFGCKSVNSDQMSLSGSLNGLAIRLT